MQPLIDKYTAMITQAKHIVKKRKKRKQASSHQEILDLEHALSQQSGTNTPTYHQTAPFSPMTQAWKFWLIGIVAVLLGYFLYESLEVLYLIMAGFILSMALESVIVWLQYSLGRSRGFSILITYIFLLLFLFSGLIIVVPFVVQQIADIINLLLAKINVFQQVLQSEGLIVVIENSSLPTQLQEGLLSTLASANWMQSIQTSLAENISQIVSVGSNYITNAGSLAVSIVVGFFSAFVQISIVFIVAIFFTLEKEKVVHFLARVSGKVSYTELKLRKLYMKLGFWLKGQLLLCLIIGCMVGLGLTIVGWIGFDIPNKFTLALIAGLTEFIPYVGPFMGMVPALLLGGLSYGWGGVLAMVILYRLIQQSENNFIVPVVMSQTLGVSPLLIFLCMILGGSLFGLLGVVLAVPFAVIVNILFEDYKKSIQPPLDKTVVPSQDIQK